MRSKILIVDDEKLMRVSLEAQLTKEGFCVKTLKSAGEALKYMRGEEFDIVVSDLRLPGLDGIEFLKEIKNISLETIVIIMTAYGTVESAVTAMKNGAFDYICKPFSTDELIMRMERSLNYKEATSEVARLRCEIQELYGQNNIIGKSKPMMKILDTIQIIAARETTVLIQGESGTGKELIAGAIHYNSSRKDGPFIKLSCAALNKEILESELFGHEKGAFTGAIRTKKGKFELSDGGSIFLDDVDDIPIEMQVKLLRVLQEREYERVGGEDTTSVNVRLICATKVDLANLVKQEKFREDLYYRMNVVTINLPSLRERIDDIPLLVNFFIRKYSERLQITRPDISQDTLDLLMEYGWPGNVRELENVVEHALVFASNNKITVQCLPESLKKSEGVSGKIQMDLEEKEKVDFQEEVTEFEKKLIKWAFKKADGNQVHMAEILGMPRTTLRNKMIKLNLSC
ncbi:response regulator [Candidatus Scalindua japonica]|uniref:Response regulator n=1 Tax=Candidatus Scalindua japonica TaxID=1284222 RepID=A0A286TZR8_9BACT|nr:sigma-54 dependent transcriptional regulator [Candidatus Scalindua japonica]GAX61376.1 response regulator [Candidatus Scalindua japonica]